MAIDINSLTKRYANPWDTSFSYLDASGNNLGTGYDSYQDAIRKLAFNVGKTNFAGAAEQLPTAIYNGSGESGMGMTAGSPAMPAGWMYSIAPQGTPMVYDGSGESGMSGGYTTGGVGSPAFATEQALYDYMLKAPTGPISYDSTEKYGRSLTDGQMQNMFALLSDPTRAKQVLEAYSGVPDWTYHREGYNAAYNPTAGINVSGANALVGSTPVFGADGKITGYKITNPKHINGADTSGRVQSSTNGATKYNADLAQYATPMGDDSFFVKAGDIDKFGYTSMGASSYSKAPTMAEKIGKAGTMAFLGSAVGGALGFGPLAGGNAVAGAAGTGGSMFEGLGDWFSNLFTDGGAAAEGLSDSFWSDWMAGGAGETGSGLSGATNWLGSGLQSGGGITGISPTTAISGITGDIPGLGTLTEGGMLIPAAGGAAVPISSLGSGFLSSLYQQAVNDPLGTAAKAYRALQSTGALSGGLQAIGGYLAGNAAQDAAKTSAQAQIEAARIAADAAKFKPVGVTTRFGQSQFTKDAQGNVVSAGYSMPADIRAMQDSLLGAAPGMLSQFTGSQAATAPMGVGAQRAMSLGNQYLNTDPMAQAQKYYDDQQAIMATGRARDQAGALTDEFNRGTYGLATGATGMMGAANPRLEAMYNAQRQQDLQASANATQGGMDYAKFGAGLVGTGGNLLRDMYGTQSAAYSPFGTALTGAQNIEGLGQNALDLSVNMGKVASPAQSGQLLGQGMLGAAQTMQQANQYSPWGTALMNAGNALGSMQQPQQQQQYAFNPFTGVRL